MSATRPSGTTLRIVTRGRVTGQEHVATTWFAAVGDEIYVAARHGTASDWLQNALAATEVELRQRRQAWRATVAPVTARAEVTRVVDAFASKYARHPAVIDAWRAEPPVFARFTLEE